LISKPCFGAFVVYVMITTGGSGGSSVDNYQKLIRGLKRVLLVPCSEIFKANLHILSTIFGHLNLNSKWPLCYKTNLSWNIAYFIEILEEVLSFCDYYVLCSYPLSFLEHKKDDLFEKNISTVKVNIP